MLVSVSVSRCACVSVSGFACACACKSLCVYIPQKKNFDLRFIGWTRLVQRGLEGVLNFYLASCVMMKRNYSHRKLPCHCNMVGPLSHMM